MLVQQCFKNVRELLFLLRGLNGREVVEDVEGSNVLFMHRKNGWIAANDEGQRTYGVNAMRHPDWQLSVKILRTFL